MHELGKILFVLGAVAMAVGLMLWTGVGSNWLGRLPGDIHISGEKTSFHFPIVTCLILSLVLSGLLWLLRRF
ncbi:MAG: DUF2905 domain-containing protein [Opitutaceae bacterium]